MPRGPFVEERHTLAGDQADRDAFAAAIVERGGGVVKRRKVLAGILGGGLGIFGVVAMFPLLRSLGPLPKGTLFHTDWRKGSYAVDSSGRRVIGGRPRHRLDRDHLSRGHREHRPRPGGRPDGPHSHLERRLHHRKRVARPGVPKGYVAYSKLCTHLGCPGRTLRTATAAVGLSVSPVDVQRHQRCDSPVRSRAATAAPAAAVHRRRRATFARKTTTTSPLVLASGSAPPHE